VLGEASLRGRRCRVLESIEIATEVLVFIKDYRGLVLRRGDLHHVACRIRPRLQVTFFASLEDFYPG
jgi:hypothetical protein